jgi:hypothetical protein
MDFISRATVHACRKSGRHFLVMEEDEAIFKSVLKPLILEPVVEVSKKPRFEGGSPWALQKKKWNLHLQPSFA